MLGKRGGGGAGFKIGADGAVARLGGVLNVHERREWASWSSGAGAAVSAGRLGMALASGSRMVVGSARQ